MARTPTVKACIKRLHQITIKELKSLSSHDLKEMMILMTLLEPIRSELLQRKLNYPMPQDGSLAFTRPTENEKDDKFIGHL